MNKKDRIEIIIICICLVFLFFGFVRIANKKKGTDPFKKQAQEQSAPKKVLSASFDMSKEKVVTGEPYPYLLDAGKKIALKIDPFTGSSIKLDKVRSLNGILFDKDHPMAIINGNIVKIGDSVDDSVVKDIKHDRVIINNGTNDEELTVE